jgi:hypothetical protein
MSSRVCSTVGCGESDPTKFHASKTIHDGLQNYCMACKVAANKKSNGNRMTLNGQHVSPKEPYHTPGTYNTKAKAKKEKVKHGFVYIITNPAWPTWVKVGLTTEEDTKKRLSSYQTGSPMRDYVVYDEWPVDVARDAEKVAHGLLKDAGYAWRNEWFQCSPEIAELMIRGEMADANTREEPTPPRAIRYKSGGDYIKASTEWVAARPTQSLSVTGRPEGEKV